MTKRVKTIEISRGNEVVLGDGEVTTEVIEDSNKIAGSTKDGVSQRQDLATEIDFSEEMNRLGETTGRVSFAQPADKKDTF